MWVSFSVCFFEIWHYIPRILWSYEHHSYCWRHVKTNKTIKRWQSTSARRYWKRYQSIDISLTATISWHKSRYSIQVEELPIYKKGDRYNLGNYRPVSLTSIVCKLLECIIISHINKHLNTILVGYRHGFKQGLSCTTQLVTAINNVIKNSDINSVHAAILDFFPAFGDVFHQLLVAKPIKTRYCPAVV